MDSRASLLPANASLLSAYDLAMASTPSPVPDLLQKPSMAPKPRSPSVAPSVPAQLEATVGSYALRSQPRKKVRFSNEG